MADDYVSQLLAEHPELADLTKDGWGSYPDLIERVMTDADMGALRDLMLDRHIDRTSVMVYMDTEIGSPELRASLALRFAHLRPDTKETA